MCSIYLHACVSSLLSILIYTYKYIYNYVWDVTIWNVQCSVIVAFHYVKCLYLHVKCLYLHVLYTGHTVCFLQMVLTIASVGVNFTIIPKNTIILDRSMCAGDLVYYAGEFSI